MTAGDELGAEWEARLAKARAEMLECVSRGAMRLTDITEVNVAVWAQRTKRVEEERKAAAAAVWHDKGGSGGLGRKA
jgi:hypothetical protein